MCKASLIYDILDPVHNKIEKTKIDANMDNTKIDISMNSAKIIVNVSNIEMIKDNRPGTTISKLNIIAREK